MAANAIGFTVRCSFPSIRWKQKKPDDPWRRSGCLAGGGGDRRWAALLTVVLEILPARMAAALQPWVDEAGRGEWPSSVGGASSAGW